jgi:hypothetical protein
MSDLSADKLAKIYIKMRDTLQQMEREHEERVADLKSQMETVETELMEICKATGADSIKTPHGTVIRSVKTRYWTSDWESMHNFIQDHKAFDLLERRVHQTNMKSWLEENPNFLPQGLNSESRYSVTVRRSK